MTFKVETDPRSAALRYTFELERSDMPDLDLDAAFLHACKVAATEGLEISNRLAALCVMSMAVEVAQNPDPTARAIRCPRCGAVSHNPSDVVQKYCGACHEFHDDKSLVFLTPADLRSAVEPPERRGHLHRPPPPKPA